MALNLFMHGIDPGLDFSDLNGVREVYEKCTKMTVPDRQPYAGDLVFTAFSGSHQDAIKKGLEAMEEQQLAGNGQPVWDVPYLTVDPADLGRHYREVIRVNSQSGKGGIAYLLESEFGIVLPKEMQREFGPLANDEVDRMGREVTGTELREIFWREYIERTTPFGLEHFQTEGKDGTVHCRAVLRENGQTHEIAGQGNGPIAAFVKALTGAGMPGLEVANYHEHALDFGAEATAIAYVQVKLANGCKHWGAAVDTNIELASIKALLSAVNRGMGTAPRIEQ
jgi:2-isopropylmalate synthase